MKRTQPNRRPVPQHIKTGKLVKNAKLVIG
jgi:hypothetical protein